MKIIRHRNTYWSGTRLAYWFENLTKSYPIIHTSIEDLFDGLQDIVFFST